MAADVITINVELVSQCIEGEHLVTVLAIEGQRETQRLPLTIVAERAGVDVETLRAAFAASAPKQGW